MLRADWRNGVGADKDKAVLFLEGGGWWYVGDCCHPPALPSAAALTLQRTVAVRAGVPATRATCCRAPGRTAPTEPRAVWGAPPSILRTSRQLGMRGGLATCLEMPPRLSGPTGLCRMSSTVMGAP
eukprot:COSAG01_NODE_956_length_12480_cov_109.564090_2_plen_126_part_00